MHRSLLGRASVFALATIVNDVFLVARIKSLYPLLFAAFIRALSSPPDTSVSLGTFTVHSRISSYPLSSAMAFLLEGKLSPVLFSVVKHDWLDQLEISLMVFHLDLHILILHLHRTFTFSWAIFHSFQMDVYQHVEKFLNQYLLPFLESNSNHNDVSLLLGGLFTCNFYKL